MFKGVGVGRSVLARAEGGRSGNDEKGGGGEALEEGPGPGVSQEGGEEASSVPRMVPGCRGEGTAS